MGRAFKEGVSQKTALTSLICDSNQLTTLDISKNTALTLLLCYNNSGIGSTLVVKAWFDNNSIPTTEFTSYPWDYNGRNIAIDYQKVNL